MSLFIPFKPLHQNPVKFQGDQSGQLSHSNSSDSLRSKSVKADSQSGRKSPAPEQDQFSLSKRSHSKEDLQVTSHALDEEGGSFNADHRQALLNDWLNTNEDDELMELVRKNLEEKPEKPADSSAPKKQDHHRNLNLTSQRLGEEGGFSFTSFMLEAPQSHDKGLFHPHRNEPNSRVSSGKNTPVDELSKLEFGKPGKSKKRKFEDLLGP